MLPSTRQTTTTTTAKATTKRGACVAIILTGGRGDWGQLVLLVIHKDAKSFHKQKTFFFSFFLRRIARASALGCEGGGVAIYTTRGRSICVCVCVCLGFLVITLITREIQQCMMKCFQKYNFPSLSFSFCLSVSLSLTLSCHFSCARHKISKFLHTQDFMLLLLLSLFLHLINSTLTNIEIMCTGPTKMSPRAASSLRVSHQKTNGGTGTEIEGSGYKDYSALVASTYQLSLY